jgi:Tol biopolymer transport system component
MALAPGTRLGPYEIVSPLGAGGMGEVYRAADARLAREVALKVLPAAFARDAERMARFAREAKILASLNHPNIASVYGLEDAAGVRALVMELVEGRTLADRLEQGALPSDEALLIGQQICEALEYAHERGIVHRDLKPANVKLASLELAKLLDFGLAKAIEGDPGAVDPSGLTSIAAISPTHPWMATEAGIILGTAAYMSPEQARGQSVHRRTDIWAFGCVLYEMLTGKRAFQGETTSDTLAAVIRADPDWTVLPPNTPLRIRELLRRCLTKDPRRRLQAIGDARIAIDETLAGGGGDADAAAPVPASTWRRVLPWAVAVASVCVAISLVALWPAPRVLPLRKFQRSVDNLQPGMFGIGGPAVAPDGTKGAYQRDNRIFVWEFDRLDVYEIAEIEGPRDAAPTPLIWSPDSASIAFRSRDKLLRVPLAGGEPVPICKLPFSLLQSGAWSPAGQIYLAAHFGDIYQVSAGGGEPRALGLFHPATDVDFHALSMLPDGHLMFNVHTVAPGTRVDVLVDSRPKTIFSSRNLSVAPPAYSRDGYLILEHEDSGIWAHPFALATLQLTGEPFLIASKGTLPSVSSDGTLLYLLPEPEDLRQVVWVDRDGEGLSSVGSPQLGLQNPALSPDGTRLATAAVDEEGKEFISIVDLARGTRVPLGSPAQTVLSAPGWMPDGRVLFSSFTNVSSTIALRAADGTGTTQNLFPGIWPHLSPRGNYLEFTAYAPESKLQYLPLEGGKLTPGPLRPLVFLDDPGSKMDLRISPDETLAAYVTRTGKEMGVFVATFPGGEARWEATDGGASPVWNPDGKELFFTSGGSVMSVEVSTKDSVTLGLPKRLFDMDKAALQTSPLSGRSLFGVSPDGRRLLMVRRVGKHDASRTMVVVQNWPAEFARRNQN